MGKYMKKAKPAGEVAAMEVAAANQSVLGVRTRARALQTGAADPSSYLQLRSRRLEKPPPPAPTTNAKTRTKEVAVASNDPSERVGENAFQSEGRSRYIRETTSSSLIRDSDAIETPGSTSWPTTSNATNRRTQGMVNKNIPTSHEMEEFFAGAEQLQQRLFAEKYNFDPVNDLPLPGRYEWVRLDN